MTASSCPTGKLKRGHEMSRGPKFNNAYQVMGCEMQEGE